MHWDVLVILIALILVSCYGAYRDELRFRSLRGRVPAQERRESGRTYAIAGVAMFCYAITVVGIFTLSFISPWLTVIGLIAVFIFFMIIHRDQGSDSDSARGRWP